ncbi:MAG: outer membrane beta-barrel protein [Saprospiraceae bacterium]
MKKKFEPKHIKNIFSICLIFFLTGNVETAFGQNFKGSALLGFNLAQIDGDYLYGFRKIGWSAGGKISYGISKNKFMNLEFLYSERGSSVKLFEKSPDNKYTLRYIEIPVLFSIHDWYQEDKKYYIVRAEVGLSYGALFQLVVPIVDENEFKPHDLSYVIGLGFQFTKNISLATRYTRSMFDMLDYTLPDGRDIVFRGYFITTRIEYQF